MSGSSYWQERYLKDKARSINLSEKYIKGRLKKYYTQAGKEIEAEIESFYEKYAKDEEITLAEARKRISTAEFSRSKFEKMAKETAALKKKYGKDIPDGIKKQIEEQERILNTLSKKGAITRLQGLQANIDNAILKLYDKQQITMYDMLKNGYEDGYYRGIFRIQQQIGIGADFTAVNERAIRQAVTANHGKGNFSSRLYKHSKTLSKDLQENLTVGLIRGESVDTMAKRISRRLDVSMSNAKRLVRTETAYIHELATMESYKEAGIEKYRFLATLDNKTSEICQELDRKEFPVEKATPGENLPPMHPNCRSTTEAVFEDEIESYRTARASDGSQYQVPRDMNYEQWWNGLVETERNKLRLNSKMATNYGRDKEQYGRYTELLGSHAPKTFKEFQKIKYADGEEYGVLKTKAKGMQYYNKAVEAEPKITEQVRNIASELQMKLVGLSHRVKTEESYLRKIEVKYSPDGNQYEIKDIIRYTMLGTPENLSEKTLKAIENFKSKGYTVIKLKNTWLDKYNPYNGINVTFKTQDGQYFEVQFHTKESFELKDVKMHELYEQQRTIKDKMSQEYIALYDKMQELSSKLTVPVNIERVKK